MTPSQPRRGGRVGSAARKTTCPEPTAHAQRIGTPGRASIVFAPGLGRQAVATSWPGGERGGLGVDVALKARITLRASRVTVPVICAGSSARIAGDCSALDSAPPVTSSVPPACTQRVRACSCAEASEPDGRLVAMTRSAISYPTARSGASSGLTYATCTCP